MLCLIFRGERLRRGKGSMYFACVCWRRRGYMVFDKDLLRKLHVVSRSPTAVGTSHSGKICPHQLLSSSLLVCLPCGTVNHLQVTLYKCTVSVFCFFFVIFMFFNSIDIYLSVFCPEAEFMNVQFR